jgi:hypothetical protein
MVRIAVMMTLSLLGITLAGCDGLGGLIGVIRPDRVTVQLVNSTDFEVDVMLRVSASDDITIKDFLDELGQELTFILAAGQSTSFSRDCDDLGSIRVEDADMLIIGEVGPDEETEPINLEREFDCGDTIRYTFEAPSTLRLTIDTDILRTDAF